MSDVLFPYATHQEVLMAAVVATDGPVLELGCGWYSTPLLHQLCLNRPLCSADNNQAWVNKFGYLSSGMHNIYCVPDWDEFALIDDISWSVAFVDHAPGERRKDDIMRLADHTRYIVVHDAEPQADFAYHANATFDTFKYRFDYTRHDPGPRTSVLSNIGPIDLELVNV